MKKKSKYKFPKGKVKELNGRPLSKAQKELFQALCDHGFENGGIFDMFANGGKASIKGTKEQYQSYQDSLKLFKGNSDFEGKFPIVTVEENYSSMNAPGMVPTYTNTRNKLTNIKPEGFYKNKKDDFHTEYYAKYPKPVQPIIYQPEEKRIPVNYDKFNEEQRYFNNKFGKGNYTVDSSEFISPLNGQLVRGYTFEDKNKNSHVSGFNVPLQKQTERLNPLDILRPKEQPIQLDRKEADYLYNKNEFRNDESLINDRIIGIGEAPINSKIKITKTTFNPNEDILYRDWEGTDPSNKYIGGEKYSKRTLPEIETIPFKKDSYFTREQQGQEVGGKEYFDKKSGKKLMSHGGEVDSEWEIMEEGGEFTNPSQQYTPQSDNTRVDKFQRINPNEESFSFKTNQIKPSVATGAIEESLSPIDLVGTGIYKGLTKGAVNTADNLGAKYLPNAYKHNPFAFKPNPENWYRQMGKPGYDDLIAERKMFGPGEKDNIGQFNYEPTPYITNTSFRLGREIPSPNFKKGELYGKIGTQARQGSTRYREGRDFTKYLAETSGDAKFIPQKTYQNLDNFEDSQWIGALKPEYRDIDNFNLYERNWLQGYKQTYKPKMTKQNLNPVILKETKPYSYNVPELGIEKITPNRYQSTNKDWYKKNGGSVESEWELV